MATDKGATVGPPADLSTRKLHLRLLKPIEWWRIHRWTRGACYFSDDPANRFSCAGVSVLYLATTPETAFWEVFWDDLGTRPSTERRISRTALEARGLCEALPLRSYRVFDATNARTLREVSAPSGEFAGDYDQCQAWALALSNHPQKPDGILYESARSKRQNCLALFSGPTDCRQLRFAASTRLSQHSEILRCLGRERISVLAP